jgi:(R,R)-butanediol dehydrogenase/meso-butanediol dehydrogenase/diacetyl reductase
MADVLAALITGAAQVDLREFPEPTPADDGVVVDIAFCGICGTDIHAYQSGEPYPPAICGHEWSGTLSAVGRDVRALGEGDRVVIAAPPACGACAACLAGYADRCEQTFLTVIGLDPAAPPHGGFAPRLAVAASRVVKTDPGLSDEAAAQIEPTTVAFHAVRYSGLRIGDTALVQGAGPIGLATLQWVRAAGAGRVIVVEPNPSRRVQASAFGATHVVDVGAPAAELVAELTRGLGADVVFECAGRPAAVQSAVELARRGGNVSLVGVADGEASITPRVWLIKEINFRGALAYFHEEFEASMGMVADGRVTIEPMHTLTTRLDGLDAAFADLSSGQTEQTKVLVNPRW